MRTFEKSTKLSDVCYDIRGRVLEQARRMEEEGHRILKLNIGNPAPFGFEAPDDILKDVIHQLPDAQGYTDAKGIYAARVAVMQYYQQMRVGPLHLDNIFIGNGVSELIVMAMQALLDDGDEVLLPAPDYPLWTAAVRLAGGTPVHYRCDEQAGWFPDIADMEKKVTSRTKAVVLINPNNPTGAVYSPALLNDVVTLARKHQLMLFSDEIYDKIIYDGQQHHCIASMAEDLVCCTLGGLSKNYRVAGFRVGWLVVTGALNRAKGYLDGLNMLASMRMCANVPCQHAIQTALGGYQSIDDLVKPEGRLCRQRDIAFEGLNAIDGISCVKPSGAMYCFARVDTKRYKVENDELLMLDILEREKILLVHGSAFNLQDGCYFRVVFLPHETQLRGAMDQLAHYFSHFQPVTA
ncbi:pyridoxal phosphate-dependent aminotransferase [Aestuariibacter halophilus]|uniref:alanine transaminase n=1 Tax=Fluctibacter halophilus TaxID=226011 RepID=A0ABS8G578_9ALTE|nr:pyridoxal phosphate-dependent aminotransferase [Aestuariibacter halophilus]MCC2615649.1 pyridoxal phosphate-dependent aminotransferase [Aestuariibacter halophilus]